MVAHVTLETLDQAQLAHIQRLGLDYRADDRMKGLVMGEGMDAVRAIGELNDSVSGGGLHSKNLMHAALAAKLKERVLPGRFTGRQEWPPKGQGRVKAAQSHYKPIPRN